MSDAQNDLKSSLEQALGDAYHLERELGGGGMSRVFVARDNVLGREVVVKVLLPDLAATLSAERFTREIKLAAALQEPHIVPVHAAGVTSDGLPWYTMPFVTGETLRVRLSHGIIPLHESLGILGNIAHALAYAHEHGIVHRDIKPENVLLSSGTAIVTDFGIAKALSASTHAPGATLTGVGTAIGTPAYMAPEQAVGDAATDQHADIYSWGVVAYELLTGAHPFARHVTSHALVSAHLTETPAPISASKRDVPATINALVMQCLAKNPADRPANARELLRVLDSLGTPSPTAFGAIGATRSTSGTRLFVGAAIMVALILGGVTFMRGRPDAASAITADRSIAVLPFENATRDSTQEYFADGLTEELIGRLATIGLRVTGRNSVFTFKGQHPTPKAVGVALGVGTVLTGSVRKLGNQLHVSGELTNTKTDSVLWTFKFDRAVPDILALQAALIDSVAEHFRISTTVARRSAVVGTTNLEARDAYIRGQYLYNHAGLNDVNAAIVEFDRAITLDSSYAAPHAGKAVAIGWLADGFIQPAEVMTRASAEARRAIALDSMLADGWSAAAVIEASWGWNSSLVRNEIDHAKLLNGGDGNSYLAEVLTQMHLSNIDEANRAVEQGLLVDPLSVPLQWNRSYLPLIDGRRDEALAAWKNVPQWIQEVNYGDSFQGIMLMAANQLAQAESVFVHAEQNMKHRSPGLGVLYARTGRRSAALRMLADIERTWPAKYIQPEFVAELPAALGDTAAMYKWLERGVTARSAWVNYLGVIRTGVGEHRREAHYLAILKRAGVVAEPMTH